MAVLFYTLLIFITICYLISRRRYQAFIQPVEVGEYPFKAFLGIPLYLLDKSGYSFNTGYDRRLLIQIIELKGHEHAQYHLRIHWASKLWYLLLSLLLISLLGSLSRPDGGLAVFAVGIVAASFFLPDRELGTKIRKRRLSIQLDFPDFLNKLTLLINAGMTVSRAWDRITTENSSKTALFVELQKVSADIRGGKPENMAYEDFSRRCRIPEISRFVSVTLQNLKKGNAEIVSVFRVQAGECWEMRKNAAKRLGEEASTKLLLPMMLMFLAILLIVITPAVIALRQV